MRRALSLLMASGAAAAAPQPGPIAAAITSKVQAALAPVSLKLVNDSHKHAGHWVDDGSAASTAKETHFRLEVVSEAFQGLPLVKRHQRIYALLDEELKAGLHALSMQLKTPAEIEAAAARQ